MAKSKKLLLFRLSFRCQTSYSENVDSLRELLGIYMIDFVTRTHGSFSDLNSFLCVSKTVSTYAENFETVF